MVFGNVGDVGFWCNWVVLLVRSALGARKEGIVRGVSADLAGRKSREGVGVKASLRCGRRGCLGRRPVRSARRWLVRAGKRAEVMLSKCSLSSSGCS